MPESSSAEISATLISIETQLLDIHEALCRSPTTASLAPLKAHVIHVIELLMHARGEKMPFELRQELLAEAGIHSYKVRSTIDWPCPITSEVAP
jgi:hypothetical protein